jgi:PIN domain nuclease of toxin-antitoxin system
MTQRRAYLLDASALLAALFGEPGSDVVNEIIDDCSIHAVNLAETLRKMLQTGVPGAEAEALLASLDLDVNSTFTAKEAMGAGRLAFEARKSGLSIGDCICLTVAAQAGQTVLTADRRWSDVRGLKVKVRQIRK